MSVHDSQTSSGAPIRTVAATVVAALAMTALVSMCSTGRIAYADAHRLEIQSASIVGPMSGRALAQAVRLDPPQAEVSVPVASVSSAIETVNRSTCRTGLAGATMTITMPEISYSCPVYAGGQSTLDSGAVTQISDPAIASVLADHPGGAGVVWLAGHRASHGGAFAAVPDLTDGSIITVSDGTYTASYRVVGRIYVGIRNDRVIDAAGNATGAATIDAVLRADHGGQGAARLLLQTCDGADNRWMVYADLVIG